MDTQQRPPSAPVEAHLERYRATGDPQAFGAVFDATSGALFRVALTLVKDPATAEDVLQQTYAVALQKLGRLPMGRPLMPWLVNVLTKEAAKAKRSASRQPDPERLQARLAGEAELRAGAGASEDAEAVRRAIETLEEPYRSAALLRWRYGLDPAEVAHVRGEPPGTTRSILSRALERLKQSGKSLPAAFFLGTEGLRGLEPVRAAVVRQAALVAKAGALGAAGTATVAVVGGGIAMSKLWIAAGALAVLLGGWLALRPAAEPLNRTPVADGAAPTEATLLAAKPEGADTSKQGERTPSRTPLDAASAPRGIIQGHVKSADGRPVSGAMVILYDASRRDLIEFDSAAPDVRQASGSSGRDGRFEVAIPEVKQVAVLVMAKGFASYVALRATAGAPREIVLQPSGVIRGRVLDVKGGAVSGAEVSLYALVGAFHTERHATSAADGSYRLEDVPTGGDWPTESRLVVDVAGYARQILDPDLDLMRALARGEEAMLNVVLSRGAHLEGRVVERGTGKPVEGANVALWRFDGLLMVNAGQDHPAHAFLLGRRQTGADGLFSFDGVPTRGFHDTRNGNDAMGKAIGSWICAAKPGFATVIRAVTLSEDGGRIEVELEMRRALSIEGRVVDEEGHPVAGARVWASVLREGASAGIPAPLRKEFPVEGDVTGDDGTYRLDGVAVPEDGEPPLGVSARPAATLGEEPRSALPFQRVMGPYEGLLHAPDLQLREPRFPRGRVRVLDAAGTPVVGAEVGFWPEELNERTDAQGLATVTWATPLEPGEAVGLQTVHVHAAGYALARAEITLTQEKGVDPTETVVPLSKGHRLAGIVTAEEGPIPHGVTVTVGNGNLKIAEAFPWAHRQERVERNVNAALDPFREYRTVTVGPDGAFFVDDLPAGPYHVIAKAIRADLSEQPLIRGDDPVYAERSGVASGASVALVLPLRAAPLLRAIDVRVLDADTDEPTLRPFAQLNQAGRMRSGRRIEPGLVRIEDVSPGKWRLTGGSDGYAWIDSGEIDVTESVPREPIVLRARKGISVTGKPALPVGFGNTWSVILEPFDAPGRRLAVAHVYAGGSFEIRGVLPGRYRISAISASAQVMTQGPSMMAPSDAYFFEVGSDGKDVAVVGEWKVAGALDIGCSDPRFVGAVNGFLSEAQAELGRKCALVVRDAGGRVILQQEGFGTTDPGIQLSAVLPPGLYLVRFTVPGEPAFERRVEVIAGKKVPIDVGRR